MKVISSLYLTYKLLTTIRMAVKTILKSRNMFTPAASHPQHGLFFLLQAPHRTQQASFNYTQGIGGG